MRNEQLYSPDELGEILGVSPSTLARWRRTGDPDLPYLRLGGRIRYRARDIAQFLDDIDGDKSEAHTNDDGSDEEEDDSP